LSPAAVARDVRNVTDRIRNPFGMSPPCDRFVPGYGDANADFHVIGDHPGVHGGVEAGVPFVGRPWSDAFFGALRRGGLFGGDSDGDGGSETATETDPDADPDTGSAPVSGPALDPDVGPTFLSYRHACVPEGGPDADPDADAYAAMEPFFDAELRAIAAHVLLPVGRRATEHVLTAYTARPADGIRMEALHATEVRGAGWLVVPIGEPADWTGDDADRLVAGLRELRRTDFRRVADLGRFIAGDDPYLVR
jgi:uracil-DNA glycosylase